MKKIRQGNDTFFSVLVFNKKAILSGDSTQEEASAVDLSQVKNLKVQGVRLHPESFFFLPSKVEGNIIKVEFPSERQELGAYDVQIDYDTDNETSEDGLLHHRLRLALCRVIETNDYCNEDSSDIDEPIKAYVLDAFKGEKGKSALELYNTENDTYFDNISDIFKSLLPQDNNSNNFIDYLFPNNIILPSEMKEELRWKLNFIIDNFDIVEKGKIKMLQQEKELYNDSQAISVLNSTTPSDICLCFYRHSDNYLNFYPKYIKEINGQADVYFNYYIFNNNTSNDILLRDFQWQQINLNYDTDNKIFLLIVEMASKKSILIEMDLSNIKDELKNINGYLMLFSYADFTEKNPEDMASLLDNYHFSRVVAQIGGDVESWRPYRYVSFSVESVETKEFEYLNNSIYNNMLSV